MTTPIERGAEALMAPVHAPMNTHSGHDGSCVSCPWPLHEAETPEGITRAAFESIDVGGVGQVLEDHRAIPVGSPNCACGWRIGLSLNDTESDRAQHRTHQATAIKAHLLDGGVM